MGPAERVTRAARSMTFGPRAEGLFVTLFHARLELATGRLRYVDAGHGHCLVRRAQGAVERLGPRSLPLGVGLGEVFEEGEITLRAGDLLVACSDGLLEVDESPIAVDGMLAGLEPAAGAGRTAELLLARATEPLADDVTILVLRRLPAEASPLRDAAEPAGTAAPARHPEWRGRVLAPSVQHPARPAGAAPPPLEEEESFRGLFLRSVRTPSYSAGQCVILTLAMAVAFLEWRLGTSDVGLRHPGGPMLLLAFAAALVVGLLLFALLLGLSLRAMRLTIAPMPVLASRARQIAAGWRVPIPYQDRDSEIGDLAVALQEWQEAAAVREVLLRSAPVGISRLDAAGVIVSCNDTACVTLGYRREQLEGRPLLDLVHPDDRHLLDPVTQGPSVPGAESAAAEGRLRRGDGGWLWCSTVVAPIPLEGGPAGGYIHILEDVSERRRQAEWAAAVQREMLPARPLPLAGYELAGRCLAARYVAGDLYDWVDTGDGHLELTLADVMGKGMGAALLMAALRTALRAAPGQLGPAEQLTRAAASMTFGADCDGLFVTLFHARLELATGRLRYVDAGHGYWLIRRAGGAVDRLPVRSMPLGLGLGEVFREGETRLDPGDVLLVCSDGLLELSDEPVAVDQLAAGLEPEAGAVATVDRLLGRVSGPLADDVTVLVLRRMPLMAEGAPVPSGHSSPRGLERGSSPQS
jgi:sigma-B regulation protein RsbU (phosphoserine phosphatase)